ncbi:T9SS type A sorting domain-containing protein [Pontibacter locisalis]|uniref:T9SS type A sorting domain-containing protein n=1 Tax=Pontibacter locisalis TaxID=1719035 RepID=A0ABW5ILE3_9BACT
MSVALTALILSFSVTGFAQTFTSSVSGNWRSAATWGKVAPLDNILVEGIHYPGASNDVTVAAGTVVTVGNGSSSAKCKSISLKEGSGNTSGSQLTIESVLEVVDIKLGFTMGATANHQPILRIIKDGHLKISNAIDYTIGGNGQAFFVYYFDPGTTIEYNGAGDQTVMSFIPYKNLILSGGGNKTPVGALSVAENLTINNTANFQGGSSSLTHSVGGNWINNSTFTAGNSTINLNGATSQEIKGTSATQFHHLTMNGTGTKSSIRGVTATGNLTINNPATFEAGSFTHTVGGNWTNNGTFVPGTSSVVMNGTTPQQIGGTVATTFNNLTASGTQGTTLTNNIRVQNSLTLNNSNLNTGTGTDLSFYNLVTLDPTATLSGETDASYIKGRVATQRPITSAGATFGGIGLNAISSSMNPGEIRVERVTGFPRQGNGNYSVPRYYEVKHVSGDVTDLDLKMEFSFLNTELQPQTISDYELVREVVDGDFDKVKSATAPSRPLAVQNTDKGIFGRYTLSNRFNPLPVDLVWFKAETKGNEVLLTWQTAWELENRGFEIQLSKDGKSFEKVGFVEAGSPNKTGAQSYAFLHDNYHGTGTRFYRLAQQDLDGTINYSIIRSVEIQNEGAFAVYPNPFINELTVILPTNYSCQVVLTNHLGKQVYSASAGASQHSIRLSTPLQNGVYFLTVQTEGNTYTQKVIKR